MSHKSLRDLLIGFLIGGSLGTLLFKTKKGKKLQTAIAKKYNYATNQVQDLVHKSQAKIKTKKEKRKLKFSNFFFTPYDKKKPAHSFFKKICRVFYLSSKGFYTKECYLRSSLLNFYTLLALVPLFAIIFSIAKGFGFEEFLQKQILQTFTEQQEVFSTILRFSYAFLKHLQSQTILGIGIFFLFFSVFGLFENIEKSLNNIWNVKKNRTLIRRALNYLASIIIFPVFFIFSISVTIFLNTEVVKLISGHEILKTYVLTILKIAPYGLMFILFSYFYIFIPNCKTYYKSRFIAGVIATVLFQIWQFLYIKFEKER